MKSNTVKILHGRPISNYFSIFLPLNSKITTGDVIQCLNPHTEINTVAECINISTLAWIEVSDIFCLIVYGRVSVDVKKNLEKSFPEHKENDSFKILILKDLNLK